MGSDVNDSPDASLALVRLEDLVDVLLESDVAAEDLNLERLLVLLGSISGESILGDLGNALQSLRERVGEASGRQGQRRAKLQRKSTGTHLSMVTTLYSPDSKQQRAMWDPASA